jgi:hypothetical protein
MGPKSRLGREVLPQFVPEIQVAFCSKRRGCL